jgi:pre-mRNA-splicing factor SYF1
MAHGSQFADPRRHTSYWNAWHEFEVAHGNEETFREMLRVKRSVQMAFRYVHDNSCRAVTCLHNCFYTT